MVVSIKRVAIENIIPAVRVIFEIILVESSGYMDSRNNEVNSHKL